jgi:hypothetical protein
LDALKEELIARIQRDEELSLEVDQLKEIGSQVLSCSDEVCNRMDQVVFRSLQSVTQFLAKLPSNHLAHRILSGTIEIKHYDKLVKYIKRLVGDLEYTRLNRVESSRLDVPEIDCVEWNRTQIEKTDIYEELVPDEWKIENVSDHADDDAHSSDWIHPSNIADDFCNIEDSYELLKL